MGGEQVLRDDEPERGVAEQRERLVVGRGRVFVRVRGVGERPLEEGGVAEAVAEPPLELRHPDGIHYSRCLRKTSVAFVPPKPKAFDSAISTSCLRAWVGTQSRAQSGSGVSWLIVGGRAPWCS